MEEYWPKDPGKADAKEQKEDNGAHFRSVNEAQHTVKGHTQGKSKVHKGKGKEPFPSDWAKEKESKTPSVR